MTGFRRSGRRLLVGVSLGLALGLPARAWGVHAVAQFGQPKYPAGFTHFDYVNPDAPRGGTLTLSITSQNSSFDKLNPFTLKGKPRRGSPSCCSRR